MIDILGLYALWGTSLPMSKHLLSFVSPSLLTAVRMLVSGVVLFFINYVRDRLSIVWDRRFFLYNGQMVIAIFLKYFLRNWSLDYMPASKMSFMLNIAPFIVALGAYFVFNDRLTKRQWIGLVIGFIGMIPLLVTSFPAEAQLGEFLYISWPEIAIFAAVCADTYSMIIARIVIREHKQSVVLSNGIRTFGAGIVALIGMVLSGASWHISDSFSFFGWLSILIVVSNIVCQNYRLYLLKFYSVTFLSFTDFISPLFTAFYSWLFLGELFYWHYAASAAIVFVGLTLFYQDELQQSGIIQQ